MRKLLYANLSVNRTEGKGILLTTRRKFFSQYKHFIKKEIDYNVKEIYFPNGKNPNS